MPGYPMPGYPMSGHPSMPGYPYPMPGYPIPGYPIPVPRTPCPLPLIGVCLPREPSVRKPKDKDMNDSLGILALIYP